MAAPASDTRPLTRSEHAAPLQSPAMVCPDPSAHHHAKNSALQNQASAAALYSHNPTSPARANESRTINPLGADGKLSSASAATSLKYAKAQDLPSYPVVGIDTKSSAGAAALLANQNKKSPEWWKPEQSAAAGKAALLANGYKMAPLWQPEASAAGSKAAILAHRDGAKLNLWQPEASAEGHSAALLAMEKKAIESRQRAQSNPPPLPLYPDSENSAKNALGAATLAHSASTRARPQANTAVPTDSSRLQNGALEAARIQHAKSISRDMYGSAPPVAIEVEEQKHNAALRASAISMAKKIYDVQQQQRTEADLTPSVARTGATAAQGQQLGAVDDNIKQQALRYIGIQEAAQKLAQERLAKIGYDENAAYRSYYGYDEPTRSKLSLRRGRNRAYSASEAVPGETSDSDEDDFRSRRIRSQMEQFNKKLADVDAKKRENDRKMLLAAAQRKVQAQMQGLDKKIYDETGRMSSSMIDDWDEKARQRAVANSEARMENHGKIHIGNGKWMDQEDIDAIAQARIQPTLDEITEKTAKRLAEDEKRRAEEEERRLDMEHEKRRIKIEKERADEIKAEEKHIRDEEKKAAKARAAEEKLAAKQEKEAEKARKAEAKRLSKEERRKSKEASAAEGAQASHDNDDLYQEPIPSTDVQPAIEHDSGDPTSPNSHESSKGFKSLLTKLKRHSKHSPTSDKDDIAEKDTGFVGGANLRNSTLQAQSSEIPSQPNRDSIDSYVSAEAKAPTEPNHAEPLYVPHVGLVDKDQLSDVSSLNGDKSEVSMARSRPTERVVSGETVASGGESFEEARDHFDETLAPPPAFVSETDDPRKANLNRESKFQEVGL